MIVRNYLWSIHPDISWHLHQTGQLTQQYQLRKIGETITQMSFTGFDVYQEHPKTIGPTGNVTDPSCKKLTHHKTWKELFLYSEYQIRRSRFDVEKLYFHSIKWPIINYVSKKVSCAFVVLCVCIFLKVVWVFSLKYN